MSWEATPSIASSSSNDDWDYIMLAGWGRTKPSTAVASTGGEDAMVKLRRNTAYRGAEVGGDSVGSAVIGGMEAKIHPHRQNREAGEPERAND